MGGGERTEEDLRERGGNVYRVGGATAPLPQLEFRSDI